MKQSGRGWRETYMWSLAPEDEDEVERFSSYSSVLLLLLSVSAWCWSWMTKTMVQMCWLDKASYSLSLFVFFCVKSPLFVCSPLFFSSSFFSRSLSLSLVQSPVLVFVRPLVFFFFSLGLSLSLVQSPVLVFVRLLVFFFFHLSFRSASLVLWCSSPCVLCFFLSSQFSSSSVCLYFFLFVPCVFFLFRFVICPLLPPLLLLCWGLSLAFIKPEKVLCPGLQKWRASWRREIVASGRASWV